MTVLNSVLPEDHTCGTLKFDNSDGVGVKILGLQWNHQRIPFLIYFLLSL